MIVVMIILFSSVSDSFLTLRNFISIYREGATVGFLSVGMAYLIGCGEVDLSCGTIVALMVIVTGRIVEGTRLPLPFVLLLAVLISVCLELLNYVIIHTFHISAFITTLAMSTVYKGLRFYIAFKENGLATSKTLTNKEITVLGGKTGYIYYSIIALLIVIVIAQVLLKLTKYGNDIYALGSNKKAAVLAGVNEVKVKFIAFGIMGVMCGLSSIFMLGRLGAATVNVSDGMEFLAVSSVVIGGASIWVYGATGGVSDAVGGFVGMTFMFILKNGLMKINVDSSYISMLQGLALLVIMSSDLILEKISNTRKRAKMEMLADVGGVKNE